jgi:outer membrane protein TolC
MSVSRILVTIAVWLPLIGFAQADKTALPDSLTLRQVLDLVAARNPNLEAARATLQAAQARVDENNAGRLPNVDVTGSYTWLDPIPYLNFATPAGDNRINFTPNNVYKANLTVTYLAYDFGRRRAGIDLAKAQEQGSEAALKVLTQDLAYNAVQTFYGILFLQRNEQVQLQQIDNLNENLKRVESRVRAESATEFDRLTFNTRLAAARNQLADVRNQLRIQQAALRRLLGAPANVPIRLVGSIDPSVMDYQKNTLLDQGKNRPELTQAQTSLEAARMQLQLTKKTEVPTLGVFASGGVLNGYQPNIYANIWNYAAGATVSIPVFRGFKERYMRKGAEANVRATQSRNEALQQQIDAEISVAFENLVASREKLDNSAILVKQAEAAVTRARKRYEQAVSTSLELIDSEQALINAKLQALQAEYGYLSNQYSLKRAVGEPALQ